jgi:hypothetical protein
VIPTGMKANANCSRDSVITGLSIMRIHSVEEYAMLR